MTGFPDNCRGGVAIVDDEVSLVGLYLMTLKRRGIPVCFIAYSGIEAIQKFTGLAVRPRVVVMDNRMPGMSGIETIRQMLLMEPGCKIIFVSADDRVKDQALSCGASVFLKKPVSLSHLTSTIQTVLFSPAT